MEQQPSSADTIECHSSVHRTAPSLRKTKICGSVLIVQLGWYCSRFISSLKYAMTASDLPYAILQCPFYHVPEHSNFVAKEGNLVLII
jgi:hypothetical protein